MRRVLSVTWDGPGQSYLQSLFFPIFAELASRGYRVDVLQNTYAGSVDVVRTSASASSFGLVYAARRVPSALRRVALPAVVAAGALSIARVVRQRGIDAILPRSIIPAAMALGARSFLPKLRLVFDTDGLMADERVDYGALSPRSPLYRTLRYVEERAVRSAGAVLTRTERAAAILRERAGLELGEQKVFAVPNGKDPSLFAPGTQQARERTRASRGISSSAPWIVYIGALGPQYFPEAMIQLSIAIRARRPDARFTLFTRHSQAATELLRTTGATGIEVGELSPEQVPEVLAAADLGLALRATHFSQAGVSPIKVAEYLLCGTPLVATPAGDLQTQLGGCSGALLLSEPNASELTRAADWFVNRVLPERGVLRQECRARGVDQFSLRRCVDGYARALGYAFGDG